MFAHLTHRISSVTLAATLSAMTMAAMPAFAAPGDDDADRVSRQVSTAGLDLAQSSDQATLRHRVAMAVQHVCMTLEDGEPLGSAEFTGCLARVQGDAWRQAEAKIAVAEGHTVVASLPNQP